MVTVVRRGDLTVAEVAADFDIRPAQWAVVRQPGIDDVIRDRLTTAERAS